MSTIRHSGKGELYLGDKRIAAVTYLILQMLPTAGRRGDSRGSVDVIEGERNLMRYNSALTLHMEDGQRVDVIITLQQWGKPYQVQGTGPFRQDADGQGEG